MRKSRNGRPSVSDNRPVAGTAPAGSLAPSAARRWSIRGITRSAIRLLSLGRTRDPSAQPKALLDAAGTVHLDADAGDEGGLVAGQVQRRVGDVQRAREAAQGNGGQEL